MLDASGSSLIEALKAYPTIVKPNLEECQQYLGLTEEPTNAQLIEGMKPLFDGGIRLIIISLGARGALFLTKGYAYYAQGLHVNAKSTVGAGDAMVASLTYSLTQEESMDVLVRRAIAVSAAAVETEGTQTGSYARIEELMNTVNFKEEAI